MRNIFLSEKLLVIFLLIEPNYPFDIELLKYIDILIRMVPISLVSIPLFNRAHECHELPWDNPV